jgi:hypothetical protein
MATKTNPLIYGRDTHTSIDVIQTTSAVLDPACAHSIAAMIGLLQLSFKQKMLYAMDWKAKEDIKKHLSEANYHLFEGVRHLNEKLQDPKEALSNTALISAGFLGIYSVRLLSYYRNSWFEMQITWFSSLITQIHKQQAHN